MKIVHILVKLYTSEYLLCQYPIYFRPAGYLRLDIRYLTGYPVEYLAIYLVFGRISNLVNIFKFLQNYLVLSHQIELSISLKTTFIIICTLGSLPRLVKLWWMETPSPGSFFSSLILSQSGHIFFFLSSFCLSFRWNESIIFELFLLQSLFFVIYPKLNSTALHRWFSLVWFYSYLKRLLLI